MKNRESKSRELPRPLRFIVFILSIALVCLPNWIALKAGKPTPTLTNPETELALILNVEKEKEIELMDWMLNFEPVPDYAFEALASEEGISMNLKPYTSEWIYDFQTWGYTDFRIRF